MTDHINDMVGLEIIKRREVAPAAPVVSDEAVAELMLERRRAAGRLETKQVRQELQERAAAEAKKVANDREIGAAVAAAEVAQPEAVRLIGEITEATEDMIVRVKRLRELYAVVEIGNARQRWMIGRAEYPEARITIASRLPVESALITRLFQVIQHLSRMGTLSMEMPAIRAGQQEL
jgi:hypothetical protein